jgi:hypothetical protein
MHVDNRVYLLTINYMIGIRYINLAHLDECIILGYGMLTSTDLSNSNIWTSELIMKRISDIKSHNAIHLVMPSPSSYDQTQL